MEILSAAGCTLFLVFMNYVTFTERSEKLFPFAIHKLPIALCCGILYNLSSEELSAKKKKNLYC